jgi:hypothetical protein
LLTHMPDAAVRPTRLLVIEKSDCIALFYFIEALRLTLIIRYN